MTEIPKVLTVDSNSHDGSISRPAAVVAADAKAMLEERKQRLDLKKASENWWNTIKRNPSLLNEWLINQYRGEKGAYDRMTEILNSDIPMTPKQKTVLGIISQEELLHSQWIQELLQSRMSSEESVKLSAVPVEERYWSQTLPTFIDKTIEQLFAIGAHAEEMRLHRIRAIVNDSSDIHPDIKQVFERILTDELLHAKAFKGMTTEKDYQEAIDKHVEGLNALNPIPYGGGIHVT